MFGLGSLWYIIPAVFTLLALVFYKFTIRLAGFVIIPEDRIGIPIKKFVLFGKNKTLPDGKIIALNGEAGIQVDTLAPGLHSGYWLWQYNIEMPEFTVIPRGKVGIVSSKDGTPVSSGRILAKSVNCDAFQDARAFLSNGGERGTQADVIPPGVYRINTELFTVNTIDATVVKEGEVGIVSTREGRPLESGQIAGPVIEGHNLYQVPQKFIDNGGQKGLQEQVILAGTYYLNPYFIEIKSVPMTVVPIGFVGVVVSYVGNNAADVTGDTFKHGNIVAKGGKGVWIEPLDPGRYPINTETMKVELIPTTNVVLNWADAKTESHKLDQNLSTITVRSGDGFKFNMDVSQIIHVSRNNAPRVIARFGNMSNLVTQVLEPTVGNYFRNASQKHDVITFLMNRTERQTEAKKHIENALTGYDIQAVDTLIGDIVPPEQLMKPLTDRKVAYEQKITYETQTEAAVERQKLELATAEADTRKNVVDASRRVEISELDAQSMVKKASGEAEAKKINAEADAQVTTVTGLAEASKVRNIGEAQAEVIRKKVESVDPQYYALMEVANSLATNKIKLVPDIMAGGANGQGGSLADVLLGMLTKNLAESNTIKKEVKVVETPKTVK